MKKIIAFAGSSSSMSINKQLVEYACSQLENVSIEILDLNDFEMPIYSIDREKNSGIPQLAHDFRSKMHEADGIICSMAEHNRTFTVAFKNVFDWCSRVDMHIFNERPMLLMSTSTGGYGGGNVMAAAQALFQRAGASITDTFSLPSFKENFQEGKVIDEELNAKLMTCIERFKANLWAENS